jgi:protein phosphatase
MADPQVLYVVTCIVVIGLVLWVAGVLLKAKDAVPMPPLEAPPDANNAATSEPPPSGDAKAAETGADDDDPKSQPRTRTAPASERPISSSALVVALPTMHQRLDSHPEIDDASGARASREADRPSPPPPGPESAPPGPSSLSLATAMGRTDPATRKSNDDAFAIIDRHHLFVVADGAGAVGAEVASQLAVDAITASFDEEDPKPTGDVSGLSRRANRLRRAVLSANGKIRERAAGTPSLGGMVASAVALHFSPNNQRVHLAQLGDARCYRVRHGAIARLVARGAVGANGSEAPAVSSLLGSADSVDVEILVEAPQAGDVYLVCSDGVARTLSEPDLLASIEGASTLEAATTALVERAAAQGKRDDITAILVRVDAPT